MPAVVVTVPGAQPSVDVPAALTVVGASPNQPTLVLPITDPAAAYANLAANWQEVARPGRKPLLLPAGGNLATVKLTVTIVGADGGPRDPANTVEQVITQLKYLAGSTVTANAIALTWGAFDSSAALTATGRWRITGCDITSVYRQPGTNNISRATASITLKEVSDPPTVSATAAWAAPPAQPPAQWSGGGVGLVTVVVMAPGETIYSLAAQAYGTPEPGWRRILDANNISDPRDVVPGMALRVP